MDGGNAVIAWTHFMAMANDPLYDLSPAPLFAQSLTLAVQCGFKITVKKCV